MTLRFTRISGIYPRGTMSLSYKLIAEKSTNLQVNLMKWCSKMDLLALAMEDNSLVLHRLSWQRVWSIQAEDVPISVLSWRPDGRVLSVGYTNGCVRCYSIEDGTQCGDITTLNDAITALVWMTGGGSEDKDDGSYEDTSEQFINSLPSIENSEESTLESSEKGGHSDLLSHANTPALLLAGDKLGSIHIIVNGVFHLTSILNEDYSCSVCNISMSSDLKKLASVNYNTENNLEYNLYDTTLIGNKINELHYVSVKFDQINRVIEYLGNVLSAMTDLWEDGLSSVDKKMEEYAKSLPSYLSIMDEFIILLACGQARSELKSFLLDSLTAKGVKKIGLSLEMSYKSLRRYTINHIEKAIETLNFYMCDLLNVSKWSDVFGPLGLSPSLLQECINELTKFALKAQEFLFVINDSLQNLKIFFVWLYTIIVKLSGETVPTIIEEGPSPEELQMVVDFLRKRLQPVYVEGRGHTFSLDRVGQYLLDKDLLITEDYKEDTLWKTILSNTHSLTKEVAPWLIERSPQRSLMQHYKSLKHALNIALQSSQKVIEIKKIISFNLFKYSSPLSSPLLRLTSLHSSDDDFICLFPINEQTFTFLLHNYSKINKFQCVQIFITNCYETDDEPLNCEVNDLSVYDNQTLSLLFSHSCSDIQQARSYIVAQLPLDTITMATKSIDNKPLDDCDKVDVGRHLNEVTSLERFQAQQLAVSGSRKLAALLSSNGKRIQLYDVDNEEEEEEQEEM